MTHCSPVMIESENTLPDCNRRKFLKSGSVTTLATLLGGVEMFGQADAAVSEPAKTGAKLKTAVIGLGAWGREIVNTLARVPEADIAAVCDTYPASLRRGAGIAPGAAATADHRALLENKDIAAVIVATPTHQHRDIVLAALQAGKHVYCEAPLAGAIEDARAIAAAAKSARLQIFQAGLQLRADPQRRFLLPFIRSGALGRFVLARAQYHKKQSWRAASPNPEREKELNWRLSRATSPGLVGEFGCHAIDQATWYMNAQPVAVSGFGSIALWNQDGRDVPDTVQAALEFPGGVTMHYDATLANSFDGEYEMFYGSDSAVMLRESKAWLFKETDSPLLGWEVYASKETFYDQTGIVLRAGATKSVPAEAQPTPAPAFTNTPLSSALTNFVRNSLDAIAARADAIESFGADDPDAIADQVSKIPKRPAAGWVEGWRATVSALKANEAILSGRRLELKPDLYELG